MRQRGRCAREPRDSVVPTCHKRERARQSWERRELRMALVDKLELAVGEDRTARSTHAECVKTNILWSHCEVITVVNFVHR